LNSGESDDSADSSLSPEFKLQMLRGVTMPVRACPAGAARPPRSSVSEPGLRAASAWARGVLALLRPSDRQTVSLGSLLNLRRCSLSTAES
jgi:hypothetical protein